MYGDFSVAAGPLARYEEPIITASYSTENRETGEHKMNRKITIGIIVTVLAVTGAVTALRTKSDAVHAEWTAPVSSAAAMTVAVTVAIVCVIAAYQAVTREFHSNVQIDVLTMRPGVFSGPHFFLPVSRISFARRRPAKFFHCVSMVSAGFISSWMYRP